MTDKKVEPLREGSIKREGINPPPSFPKPQYHPPGTKIQLEPGVRCRERENQFSLRLNGSQLGQEPGPFIVEYAVS